jgi:hypothetical protein
MTKMLNMIQAPATTMEHTAKITGWHLRSAAGKHKSG